MKERLMPNTNRLRRYSLAEARDRLTAIVRDVETTAAVELTRRGRPVAVILSIDEYRRLISPGGSFAMALDRFRSAVDLASLDLGPDVFDGTRDDAPGREVEW
jgi:prevent-host-death family protein